SGHFMLAYFCFASIILVAILVHKTPFGLHMKASGLDATSASSVGINVNRVRLISMLLSGLFAALGGAYLTMGYLSTFTRNMVAGRGWIGIAAQAMGGSSLLGVGASTLLFSVFQAISTYLAAQPGEILPTDIITAIPYFGVFIGIVAFSVIAYYSAKKKND
ncbi:MAG: ABC transporter permease, partial [Oscillospiraceae bacterium]|nr:ABC transporter permease [Oscillospiraceae bacterium]